MNVHQTVLRLKWQLFTAQHNLLGVNFLIKNIKLKNYNKIMHPSSKHCRSP